MDIIAIFLKEMDQEAETTRKMLSRIPEDKFDWKPHQKSMTVRQLATHIAELPSWAAMAVVTTELDFATSPYQPTEVSSNADLLKLLEKSLDEAKSALSQTDEEQLQKDWTLRNGDQIYSVTSRAEVIRMSFNQTVHHRAQLGVYLRLLDVPLPGTYGPSADESF